MQNNFSCLYNVVIHLTVLSQSDTLDRSVKLNRLDYTHSVNQSNLTNT